MKFIVVIPARGGSKRLPRKNVLPLAGKPLICHSIEYALLDFGPEDVYVSTDSAEISQVAGAYGVNVVRRPEALSGDLTPTGDVLRHVSERWEETAHLTTTWYCCSAPVRCGLAECCVTPWKRCRPAGGRVWSA